mmetsp:Transcript_24570/g.57246  ORF Transcript_24570/g.57246 Transcript_24570/m.57246 type:complete len:221 (-) Transcript_24570:53-715(-)
MPITFCLEMSGRKRGTVECGKHREGVTSRKETHRSHRCRLFGGITTATKGTGKDRVTPCQQTDIGNGCCRNLDLLALCVIANFHFIKCPLTKVCNSIRTKVHNHRQPKGQATKELFGLVDHVATSGTCSTKECTDSRNILDHALVNDRNQGTDQNGGSKSTGDLLGRTNPPAFCKLMCIGAGFIDWMEIRKPCIATMQVVLFLEVFVNHFDEPFRGVCIF